MRPSREVRADLHLLDAARHLMEPAHVVRVRARLEAELRAAEAAEAAADERMRRALERIAPELRRLPEGCGE